ncbi:DUF3108 domain-containing protein [Chitinolyticbacter meiyuanensis]|uniref:DUF3108 domain-containing protein n=1 Tax=Chitinolyticbacter meiyuanensis TaxID=682798 RepID=UPI0011E5DF58|nr:DUF3108 domain-containing protein [Chitinolyticbacter meiyuanensis]
MRWPWLKRRQLLLAAFVLSLLLHVFGLTGDTLFLLAETQRQAPDTPLRKAKQQLAQTDISSLVLPPELAGVTPVETLQVALGRPPAPAQPAKPATAARATTPAPAPRAQPTAVPTPVPTQPATPVPTPATLSASASAAATPEPTAAPSPTPAPTPATATATATARKPGFPRNAEIIYFWGPIPAKLTWHVEHGQYEVKLRGSLPGNRRELTSRGEITAEGVRPLDFTDLRNGQIRNQAVFDWANGTATLNDKGTLHTEPLSPGDQDLFSAAFHLAMRGLSDSTFALFNGRKRYPDVHFTIAGESTLHVGDQQVDVLLLRGRYEDREFDFWLAPKWHNLPVRMQAKMGKDGSSYDIWAGSMTIEGEQVLRPALNAQQRRP